MTRFGILALRLVTPTTRNGRPMCPCAQVSGRKLYAWTGCKQCWGTGGIDPPADAQPSKKCASDTMA